VRKEQAWKRHDIPLVELDIDARRENMAQVERVDRERWRRSEGSSSDWLPLPF
jgi:hypothetical protein